MEERTGKQTILLPHLAGPFSQREAREQLFSTLKDSAGGPPRGAGLVLAGDVSLYRTGPSLATPPRPAPTHKAPGSAINLLLRGLTHAPLPAFQSLKFLPILRISLKPH